MRRRALLPALCVALSLALPPAASAADLAPGIALVEARRWAEAQKFFEARVRENPKDPDAAYYLGRAHFAQRHVDQAVEWLEKAVAGRPGSSQYHDWLGRVYGQQALESNVIKQASLAKKIKAEFEKAVELDPGNLDARGNLISFYLQAPGFMGGSVEKARQQAAEIKKRDAVRGHQAMADVYLHEKKTDLAVKEYQAAVEKAPNDPRLRAALGLFYQGLERWDDAFAAFEAALRITPDDFDVLYQIGKTGALSGQRLDRAEECLKRYLGHKPGSASVPLSGAHYRLGMVYEKKGDRTRARQSYQDAVKLDPNLKEARAALKKLS